MSSLSTYIHDISKYPLLSAEEEVKLAEQIKSPVESISNAAKKKLANSNLRLVIFIAKKYQGVTNVPLEDIVADGNQGLMAAVEKYDVTLGYRFSTCATLWIKQAILKGLTDKGRKIRTPAHIYQQLKQYKKVVADIVASGEEVTDAAIATAMGLTVEKVRLLRTLKHDAISLDTPLGDGSDDHEHTLLDMVDSEGHIDTPDQTFDKVELRERLLAAGREVLSPRSLAIIKYRFGIAEEGDDADYAESGHTLEEVGDKFGLTRERARQIEKAAIEDLRAKLI